MSSSGRAEQKRNAFFLMGKWQSASIDAKRAERSNHAVYLYVHPFFRTSTGQDCLMRCPRTCVRFAYSLKGWLATPSGHLPCCLLVDPKNE